MEEIVYEMDLEEKKLFDMFKKYNLRKVEFNPVWGEVAFYFEDSNGSRLEPVIVNGGGETLEVSYGTDDEY